MAKQVIYSPKVTRSKSPHAHAVRTGNLVFVSGCPPYFGDMQLVKGDFAAQMRQCLTNVQNILEEAGSSLQQVVKVNVFLDRRADFEEMNQIYREYFGNDPATWPARTTVEARLPRKDFLLEIECVAEVS
jgi:reactive intermediate/imine deaminase